MQQSVVENYPGVNLSWNRVLSIAKNLPDPASVNTDSENDDGVKQQAQPVVENASRLQSMGRALQNMYIITSQDEGYTAFILTMIEQLNHECPVEITFLKHIIDYSEIPSKEALQLLFKFTSPSTVKQKINQCMMWSILARKFAGNLAESMWQNERIAQDLYTLLSNDESLTVKLFALLALESFAITGSIKNMILNNQNMISNLYENLDQLLYQHPVEQSPCFTASPNLTLTSTLKHKYSGRRFYHVIIHKLNTYKKKKNVTVPNMISHPTLPPSTPHLNNTNSENTYEIMQLQHCLEWSLDHIFNSNKIKAAISMRPRVCLNPTDSTSHCKLSSNCLQVRNDTFNLESIRATVSVESGVWYYEVLLLSNGVMQIGWGTSRCAFLPEEGCGIGDDPNGFAFDTYRSAIWVSSEVIYPKKIRENPCKVGDVVGTLLDMNEGTCTFYLNGQDIGSSVQFQISSKMLGLYPAVSLTYHQHISVNFGDRPWHFTPPVKTQFKPINSCKMSYLLEDKNRNNEEEEHDWDGPLCTLCFSEQKNVTLLPCHHTGFGKKCSYLLESCPLCRTKIDGRVVMV